MLKIRLLAGDIIWHAFSKMSLYGTNPPDGRRKISVLQKIADLNLHNAVSLLASPAILAKRSKTESDFDVVSNMELSNCKMMFQLHIPKLMLVLGSGVAKLFGALLK